MIERILTVGGLTLLSRVTGFARDIILAAMLGAGPVADAFFVAFRLPNHFRAIFAEGAFNAAFVPAYARIREQSGAERAGLFADRIFTLLLASQIVLLALALLFTPQVIDLLAPGFARDPGRFALAVDLTRITFPYLLLITLVTLYGGILNALQRFAAAAAASTLLNLSMMATLALAAFFPSAGQAAAWGVLISGVLQVLLVGGDAWRAGVMPVLRWPELDADVRRFFRALGAGHGRLDGRAARAVCRHHHRQLPRRRRAVGALLRRPPQSVADRRHRHRRRHRGAAGNGAAHRRGRRKRRRARAEPGDRVHVAVGDPVSRCLHRHSRFADARLFARGAFTDADALAAGQTLAAYAIGLLPFVLIRSTVATFFARGDTATPVKAALIAAAVNIAFKFLLMGPLAQVGLALATSIGAWINLALVMWFSASAGHAGMDERLRQSLIKFVAAGLVLAAALWLCRRR